MITVCPLGHRSCPHAAGRPASRWNRERIGPGRQPAHLWVAGVRDQGGEARVLATLRDADLPPHLAVMRVGGPRPGLTPLRAPDFGPSTARVKQPSCTPSMCERIWQHTGWQGGVGSPA